MENDKRIYNTKNKIQQKLDEIIETPEEFIDFMSDIQKIYSKKDNQYIKSREDTGKQILTITNTHSL